MFDDDSISSSVDVCWVEGIKVMRAPRDLSNNNCRMAKAAPMVLVLDGM